jgi:hypothetical protein
MIPTNNGAIATVDIKQELDLDVEQPSVGSPFLFFTLGYPGLAPVWPKYAQVFSEYRLAESQHEIRLTLVAKDQAMAQYSITATACADVQGTYDSEALPALNYAGIQASPSALVKQLTVFKTASWVYSYKSAKELWMSCLPHDQIKDVPVETLRVGLAVDNLSPFGGECQMALSVVTTYRVIFRGQRLDQVVGKGAVVAKDLRDIVAAREDTDDESVVVVVPANTRKSVVTKRQ